MAKFKILFDGELEDEVFNTEQDAIEYAEYLCSCAETGAETLHLSNLENEYDPENYERPDYEIIEVD